MNGTKESPCTRCGHSAVCSKKKDLLSLINEIDKLCIPSNGDIVPVKDTDWIHIITQCSHRYPI